MAIWQDRGFILSPLWRSVLGDLSYDAKTLHGAIYIFIRISWLGTCLARSLAFTIGQNIDVQLRIKAMSLHRCVRKNLLGCENKNRNYLDC